MHAAILGGLTAVALAGAAQAQETGNLNLFCAGTDAAIVPVTAYTWSGRGYMGGVGYGEGRIAAQLSVAVDGGKVRVKPPKSSVPLFAKEPKDGWYELADVTVDRLSIRGRLKWNRLERLNLAVDRRTGAATFGAFQGVCQAVSNDPAATKF